MHTRQGDPQGREPCPPVYNCRTIPRFFFLPFLEFGSVCRLGPDLVGISTLSALRLAIELQHARPCLAKALRKSKRFVGTNALLFSLYLPLGESSLHPPWLVAPRALSNPGNFGDYTKRRIRFTTAITPAYAHAYLTTCPSRRVPAVPRLNSRLPKPKARCSHLPNARSTTRERGNDFRRLAIYIDGSTRVVMVKPLLGGV